MKLPNVLTDVSKFLVALGFALLGAIDLAEGAYAFALLMLVTAGVVAYAYAADFKPQSSKKGMLVFAAFSLATLFGAVTFAVGTAAYVGAITVPGVSAATISAAIFRGLGALLMGLGVLFGLEFDLKKVW